MSGREKYGLVADASGGTVTVTRWSTGLLPETGILLVRSWWPIPAPVRITGILDPLFTRRLTLKVWPGMAMRNVSGSPMNIEIRGFTGCSGATVADRDSPSDSAIALLN